MKNSNLRQILLFSFCLLTSDFLLQAQAPQGVPYQAIARNSSGQAIASTAVRVRFSIRDSIATGVVRYQETHNPTTSALGLFSVNVGMGTVVSGSFSGINWGKNAKFLQIELDPAGGTSYTDLGTTQMMSVPYALHSNSANTATTASNGVPAGGTSGQVLTNCNGVAVWTTGGVCPGAITALNCASATNSGTLTVGTAASGVSSSLPYTGGNGGTYTAQTITSTGVTGLTASLAAGTLLSGAGSVTYSITGTPASSGTASFALSLGGQTCTLTRTVNLPAAAITALNCAGATNNGTLTQGVAAASVNSSVPYTGGNGGTYTAQSVSSTGVTGLTATLAAGTLLSGAGSVTYNITGTPASSGTASFALSLGGQSCALTRTVNTSGTGPINIETVLIPAGTFNMGSPSTEPDRYSNEVRHQVTLSAFRMSKYEITNAQYAAFLNAKGIGSNGIYAAGAYPTQALIYQNTSWGLTWTGTQWQPVSGKDNFPIVNVTWYGAAEFATYAGGRLPTEAEWEYACRGGTSTPFNTGNCLYYSQANYWWQYPSTGCNNVITIYPNQSQEVNSYGPNAFGLFNMHGNVLEWCSDWYGAYSTAAQTNPTGPASGAARILRGGSWNGYARSCRSPTRGTDGPGRNVNDTGFRLAFAP
jgi:formylglycine-generating enzyme required for sulfatase activity